MTQHLSLEETAALLKSADDILVITHKNPDGDAVGSALTLCTALRSLGKRCNATWTAQLTPAYDRLIASYRDMDFEPRFIVSVDIAATHLLPPDTRKYEERVDLCIDHHGSNTGFAAATYVEPGSASCCEILFKLLPLLGVELTPYLGTCIYVGLCTDTGCFKYSNTTPSSHEVAAELFRAGVDVAALNLAFFESKSRASVEVERLALNGMEFACGGRICFITVTRDMMTSSGCLDSDIEGIGGIPRAIEGVEAGVTLRELPGGTWKISVRTKELDACAICRQFGGGGHIRAAGCECSGTPFDIKVALVSAIKQELSKL